MNIKTVVVGPLEENCYIVTKNNKTLIIDPGDEFERIKSECSNLNVVEVLITHHHFDHIGALNELLSYYNLEENKRSGYFDYEIIETKGHTSDSKTYYFKKNNIMFTGDFLFHNSIGRTDLPSGSNKDMIKSLNTIKNYPKNTLLYPGHGESSTLGLEIKNFTSYFTFLS